MTEKQAAAKNWLNRNYNLHEEIRALKLKLDEMRESANQITGKVEEVRVQTQPDPKSGESRILSIVEFSQEVESRAEKLRQSDIETMHVIIKLEDVKERMILIYRYLLYKSWSYISKRLNYSESYCHEIHSAALTKIADLIDYTIT